MLNFDSNIVHLTFSHTDCSDIWPAYFGETKKYLNSTMQHYLCINKISELIPSYINPIVYNEKETYPKRLLYCLKELSSNFKYVFFDHEDMFLYDFLNEEHLENYYKIMVEEDLDHIRLIKGGDCKSVPHPKDNTLHNFNLKSKWIFSIQPSFWKINTLIKILEANLDINIWELEVKSQKVVKKLKIKAAFSHAQGTRRGLYHFDNSIYPYIATAIGKGKWNYSEYKSELSKVFEEYKIDPTVRGWS